MRQLKIPKAQTVPTGDGPKEYSFQEFLRDFVWPDRAWRATAESSDALFNAQDLLEDAKEGDLITFEESVWDVFKPIATQQGKELPQLVAKQLTRLMRPVLGARQMTKEEVEKANAEAEKLKKVPESAPIPPQEEPAS